MAEATKKATNTELTNNTTEQSETAKSNFGEKFNDLKTTAAEKLEGAKTAVSTGFDTSKTTVVDKLHQAADSIQQKVDASENSDSNLTKYGQKASEILNTSADYIEKFEPNQLTTGVQNHVKDNPGRSLLIAGAVGLLLGLLFKNRRSS